MRTLFILSTAVLCTACAPRSEVGTTTRPETVRVVDSSGAGATLTVTTQTRASAINVPATVEQVWRVLPAVYEELGLPVRQMNSSTHVIGNPGFSARRQIGRVPLTRYFDCGRTQDRPSAETYELQISVLTQVQRGESEGSILSTSLQATARPVNFPTGAVQCTSTGALEARLAEAVRTHTRG
jgi:hypothetical protein